MPHDFFSFVSLSEAKVEPGSIEAASIYLDGRRRNLASGITACLHREGEMFLYYAEGPERTMQRLIVSLRRDWRHCNMEILYQGSASARLFEGWALAMTDETMHSFAAWSGAGGRSPDIRQADIAQIQDFFTSMVSTLGDLSRVRPELFPNEDLPADPPAEAGRATGPGIARPES